MSADAPPGGEFELIAPDAEDVDEAIRALGHPRTVEEMEAVQRRARQRKLARMAHEAAV
ncbi:MAG TPA: hypothetical protein VGU20_02870 [Stellaceae bacterium]|nr:hypothetical protein [Stellaceae bacterium]